MLYLVFPGPDPPSGRRFSRCAEDKSGVFAKNNLPNFPPPRITCRVDADSVFRLPSPERRSNGGNRRAASPLAVGGNRGERNAPRRAAAPGMVFADRRDPFADWSGSDKDRCTPSVFAPLRRRRLPRRGRLAKAAGTRVDSCLAAARSGAALTCHRHVIHFRAPASQPQGKPGYWSSLRPFLSLRFSRPSSPPRGLPSPGSAKQGRGSFRACGRGPCRGRNHISLPSSPLRKKPDTKEAAP